MAVTEITVGEWLAELDKISRSARPAGQEAGWTFRALRKLTGLGKDRLLARLHAANDAGLLRCERRPAVGLDGTHRYVPFYIPLRSTPKAKKSRCRR
jgi:hypothetical protein